MSTRFGDRPMYIGGEFVASDSGEWMDSVNPATGEVHGRVPAGTVSDVDRAVQAAAEAQVEWGARSVWERGALLRKLSEEIKRRAADVVPLEAADTGNTIASLSNDIMLASGCGWCWRYRRGQRGPGAVPYRGGLFFDSSRGARPQRTHRGNEDLGPRCTSAGPRGP